MGTQNIDRSVWSSQARAQREASAGFSRMVFEQKLQYWQERERKKEGYPRETERKEGRKMKGAFQDVESLLFSSASDVSAPDVWWCWRPCNLSWLKSWETLGQGRAEGFPQFPLLAQTCPQEELIYSERLRSPPAHKPQRAPSCYHHLFPAAATLWNLSLGHPVGFIPRSGSFPRNAVPVQRSFTAHKAPCSSSPALHSSSSAAG